MLEIVKKDIKEIKDNGISFESMYIDYILYVQGNSILLEMEYLMSHNKLDILDLDLLVCANLSEVIVR